MMGHFNCRFLKPQRLIHIGLEAECKRLLESWHAWDLALHTISFGSEERLGELVCEPAKFKDNIRQTVIVMSDQMPFWVKLTPGKQLYLASEVQAKKKLTGLEKEQALGQRGGGGTQASRSNLGMIEDMVLTHITVLGLL